MLLNKYFQQSESSDDMPVIDGRVFTAMDVRMTIDEVLFTFKVDKFSSKPNVVFDNCGVVNAPIKSMV